MPDERAVVERAAAGDRRAFEQIYRAYAPTLDGQAQPLPGLRRGLPGHRAGSLQPGRDVPPLDHDRSVPAPPA